jgi:hypothetical protein
VSIQDLGSIGEFIAAVATLATLAYLAVQVRQNTRALRASTFQDISSTMSLTSEAIATHPDLSELVIKAADGLGNLTPEERVRFNLMLMMTFRRLESVFVQGRLGSIEPGLTAGFEQSVIGTIASGAAAEWWDNAKPAFSASFVAYVDKRLASGNLPRIHPGFGGPQ